MPALEQALSHLGELPGHAPSAVTPVETLHGRARRIRRARRATRGSATIAFLVLGAAVLNQASSEPEVHPVTSTTDPGTLADLVVEPSVDLRPDQTVTIDLPVGAPTDSIIIAQCGSEADQAAPEQWCQVLSLTEHETGRQREVRVRQVIQTTNGRIDCAERAERCVLGVRLGTGDYAAPISFSQDLPPLDPRITVETTSPFLVAVAGSGYEPGTGVTIAQCRPTAGQPPATAFGDCDHHRSVQVTVDDDGTFAADVYLHREIFEDHSGWGPCDPCQLQAITSSADTQAVDVDASSGLIGRASVEIRPAGPYAPGQTVELHGAGFPANTTTADIVIGWCRFSTPNPAAEPQGVGPEYAECAYPSGPVPTITTNDAGEFTIPDFPLPDAPFGWRQVTCDDPTARCGLAWHPGEGALPYFVTEFRLSHG